MTDEDFEFINPSSGNLTLTIPLGQTYTVGPSLSYQFRLFYNSSIWERVAVNCLALPSLCPPNTTFTATVANPSMNAGLGWEMHFGRLFSVQPPAGLSGPDLEVWPTTTPAANDTSVNFLYISPDGSSHTFHDMAHRPGGSNTLYTKDGSHLRLTKVNGSRIEIETPEGTKTVFVKTGDTKAGTLFCGNGVSGCWRMARREDPVGNFMSVGYGLANGLETWTVRDSLTREHRLTFSHKVGDRAGGDGSGHFQRANGDEWGDLRRLLLSVDLEAFAGSRAVFGLDYGEGPVVVSRDLPGGEGQQPGEPVDLTTRVLQSLEMPAIQDWHFTTASVANPGPNGERKGEILEVQMPSRGRVQYEWTNWSFPNRCQWRESNPQWIPSDTYRRTGIASKTRLRATGQVVGAWTYTSQLGGGTPWKAYGSDCSLARWRRTAVRGPAVQGNVEEKVFYFSTWEGREFPSSSDPVDTAQVTDFGMPYTKVCPSGVPHGACTLGSTPQARRYLSSEIYQCPENQSCTNAHLRESTYVRYASEHNRCVKLVGEGPGCFRVDGTQVAEVKVFHTDAGRQLETRWENQTGLGTNRRTVIADNFGSGWNEVVQETDYDLGSAGLGIDPTSGYFQVGSPSSYYPAANARWLLYPYSKKSTTDGGRTYVSEAFFDPTGFLECVRKWKDWEAPLTRSGQDVVVKFTRGQIVGVNRGLATHEVHVGGDHATLSTAALCSVPSSQPAGSRYEIFHTYEALNLASTRLGGVNGPLAFKASIDPSTGLPASTFDLANQETVLDYDVLGRLTLAEPESDLGEAATELRHRSPASSDPSVEISRIAPTGIELAKTETRFDFLGRRTKQKVQRPLPGGGWDWSERQWLYDAAGRLEKETTLQPDVGHSTLARTRYLDHDAFGNPRKVSPPDHDEIPGIDKTVTQVFHGVRRVKRTHKVATSSGALESVTTSTFRDGLGRVVRQDEPHAITYFIYDPAGEVRVSRRVVGGERQFRIFERDGRGFLTAEEHPELGSPTSARGRIRYERGALGQVLRRIDPEHTLSYDYDTAGRLLKIREGSTDWAEYAYGTSNSFGNLAMGKLVRSTRHNYIGDPNALHDWKVVERYTYGGALGQVSQRRTDLTVTDANGATVHAAPSFATHWTYDALGNQKSLTFPRCVAPMCSGGSGDLPGPHHTLTRGLNRGLTVSSVSNLGPTAGYRYHTNLQLERASYSNGTENLYGQGTRGMVRTQRIQTFRGATPLFDTGAQVFDGAGNMWKSGADTFVYDRGSRLLSATVDQNTWSASYSYDGFDNLTSTTRDGVLYGTYNVDNKNRYLGPFGQSSSHDFDNRGNLTGIQLTPGGVPEVRMAYDALGMQFDFWRDFPTSTVHNVYIFGPGNRRLLSFDNREGSLSYTLRDLDGKVLSTFEGKGAGFQEWTFETDYLRGPEGLFASYARGGALRFFHADHLGSPRLLTHPGGIVIGRHHYYPYGHEVSLGGTQSDDRFAKFTGHERDPHGGTDYMLGRTYAFTMQRFLSPDPARDGWNLYAYVGNNPIKSIDPEGQRAVVVVAGGSELQRNASGAFGHAGIHVTSSSGTGYADFGGADSLAGGVSGFVNEYLSQGRTVQVTLLETTDQQDAAMAEFLQRTNNTGSENPSYGMLTSNCTTSVCNTLQEGGLVSSEANPVRNLLGFDTPSQLQRSLDGGSLSGQRIVTFVFDPLAIQRTDEDQIEFLLDNPESFTD